MPPLVVPGLYLLPYRSGSALFSGLTLHSRVLLPLVLIFQSGVLTNRVADSIIGLSCIALAAVLASFLLGARKGVLMHRTLIVVVVFLSLAGIASLLSAAVSPGLYPNLASKYPLILAALFLFAACLLPFLLPKLVSKSRELESANEAARKNEIRFTAAAESTDAAFMLLDALRSPDGQPEDFLFTYLNANAEKIILKPNSQVVGARITRVLPIDPGGKLFEQFRQVVLTGTPLIHEFPLYPNEPQGPWMRHQVAKVDDGLAITASDITDRKHAAMTLLSQEQHDALTGLPNRRLLTDRLEQAIARANRCRKKVAVLLVKLDGLQQVNAEYGTSDGDQVILVIASRLRAAVRATDTVIRLEGNEFGNDFGNSFGNDFILVMPDMTLDVDVRRTAATLIAIVREPITVAGKELEIGCSIGVAVYPDTATGVDEILGGADIAMSRARTLGHNHYVIYTPANEARFRSATRYGSGTGSDAVDDEGQHVELYGD